MRTMIYLVFFLLALGAGMQVYKILTAKHDPAIWHVDPLEAADQPSPNGYRVAPAEQSKYPPDAEAPVYALDAKALAQAFDDFVLSQLFAQRIAGAPEDLWISYVQRTPKLRIPDYISVKFIELGEDRSTIAIFSRSRYGYGDLGVNEQRVNLWLGTLKSFEVDPAELADDAAEATDEAAENTGEVAEATDETPEDDTAQDASE